MKSFARGMVLFLVGSLALAAHARQAETLTLQDLVGHPERLPETVTLAKDFKFGSGGGASAGQAVKVREFNGAQVVVDAGNAVYFEVVPDDCDLLAAANKAWAPLTPAQRAVEPATLVKDASLWPERVTSHAGFGLDDGTELAPGAEYDFLRIDADGVHFYSKEHRTTLVADVAQTDLVKRARALALVEPAQRPSRIAAVLKSGLVDANGKPYVSPAIADAQIYVLYFGASWCGPCRKFSPNLVKFVNETAKDNPRLATVLLSNDREDADMLEYMQDEKMPWPAMPLETLMKTPLLLSLAGGSIPHLVVLDRHGMVLASSIEGGRYVGVERPLQAAKKLVEAGRAK